jgi:hypothetical protein
VSLREPGAQLLSWIAHDLGEMRREGGPRPAASKRCNVRSEMPRTAAACVRFSNRSVVSVVSSSTIAQSRAPELAVRWSGLSERDGLIGGSALYVAASACQ